MEKINEICKLILTLKQEDFDDAKEQIKAQGEFVHPLKLGKVARLHALADFNAQIVCELHNLWRNLQNPPHFIKKEDK